VGEDGFMEYATPVHSKLLTEAARSILRPLGLFQKGRSRTWLDDHHWWLGVVEFQPSSWSQGSYLNVGCSWLWRVKDHVSFDEGSRVRPFCGFRDEQQFGPVAEQMAQSAADEIKRYRSLFPKVSSVCTYYQQHRPSGFWPTFNAAIACALAGQPEEAQRFFRSVIAEQDDNREWVLTAQNDAKKLSALVPQTEHFRQTIVERIQQTRKLQGLPQVSGVYFG
jgi:hypothetical protein